LTLDDIRKVADAALQSIDKLLGDWFPNGVVDGQEFCVGSASGEAGKSLRVRLTGNKAGYWSDFSGDEVGRDLISLYALIHGLSNGKACALLAPHLGVALTDDADYQRRNPSAVRAQPIPLKPAPAQAGKGVEDKIAPLRRTEWVPVLPVPTGAGAYPAAHVKRGRPERIWEYHNQNWDLLGVVYRFRTSDGGKEVLPCVFAEHPDTHKCDWRWMQWIEPRPIYLTAPLRDGFVVLVVEGEKCADAAHAMVGEWYDVVSWPGGGKAVHKVDWSPLAGRTVILWADADAKRFKEGHPYAGDIMPEADQPGMKAMNRLEDILAGLSCKALYVDIPLPDAPHHIWEVNETEHDGWDVSALVEYGATRDEVAEWLGRLRPDPEEPVSDHAEQIATASQSISHQASVERSATHAATGEPAVAANVTSTPSAASASKENRRSIRASMITSGQGGVKGCRENVYTALKRDPCLAGLVALDRFTLLQVKRRTPPWPSDEGEWTEGDDFQLGVYLADHYGLVIAAIGDIERGVAQIARENGFNPVIDLFERCAASWDGKPRVEQAFETYWSAEPSEYMKAVSRMFFVGLAKRAYVPGVKHDDAPVFEGGQGEGKSTALSILAGDWFADTPFRMGDKDGFLAIQGVLIYEVAELEQFNRAEVTAVKAFMSSQKDRYREPYGRRMKDQLRRTVFAATTNEGQYFKDPSGNRRFWPVRTGRMRLDELRRDREQLLGEAVHMMRAGALWYPTRDEQKRLMSPEQEDREIPDDWAGAVWEYLQGEDSDGKPTAAGKRDKVTARQILTKGLHFEIGKIGQAKTESMRISNIMRKLGWLKKRDTEGAREYVYLRPPEETATEQIEEGSDEPLPF
jgi:putative DNA primase/helicase